jgi:hypothetical protein
LSFTELLGNVQSEICNFDGFILSQVNILRAQIKPYYYYYYSYENKCFNKKKYLGTDACYIETEKKAKKQKYKEWWTHTNIHL